MTAKIRASQLFWLLVAGRLSSCLLLTGEEWRTRGLWDVLLALLVNAAVLAAVWLPLHVARRRGALLNGRVWRIGYGLLALFLLYVELLQFCAFAEATVTADFSVGLLTAVLAVIGLLAAVYGLEAVARSATVIAVVTLTMLLLLTALLVPHMRGLHFPMLSINGTGVLSGVVRELPRTAEIAVLWALYPHVTGKIGQAYAWFIGITTAVTAMVCVVTVGVLGDASSSMAYPFYAAINAVSPYTELIAITVWLGTFFVRTALFGTVYVEQVRRVCGERTVWGAVGIAVIVLVSATLLTRGNSGPWWVLTAVYAAALAVFGVLLPLIAARKGETT